MPERSPDRPPPPRADPTRDIRLPQLPGRPGPAVPPEWSSYVPPPAAPAQHSVDEPTDHLAGSSDHPLRQGTRSFPPRIPVRPLAVVTPRRRRTTTVLWTLVLLTLAVILACGIYLVVVVTQR